MSELIENWMWLFFVAVVLLPRLLRFLFGKSQDETKPAERTPPKRDIPDIPVFPVQTSREAEHFNPRKGQPPPIVPR